MVLVAINSKTLNRMMHSMVLRVIHGMSGESDVPVVLLVVLGCMLISLILS